MARLTHLSSFHFDNCVCVCVTLHKNADKKDAFQRILVIIYQMCMLKFKSMVTRADKKMQEKTWANRQPSFGKNYMMQNANCALLAPIKSQENDFLSLCQLKNKMVITNSLLDINCRCDYHWNLFIKLLLGWQLMHVCSLSKLPLKYVAPHFMMTGQRTFQSVRVSDPPQFIVLFYRHSIARF